MHTFCERQHRSQDLVEIHAPIDRRELGEGTPTVPIPVVNLLSLIQYLFNDFGIFVQEQNLKQFWQHIKENFPWGERHPAVDSAAHIPLGLHGDDCKYSNLHTGAPEKVLVISCNVVLWCPRTTRSSRFPLCAIRDKDCLGPRTLFPILRYIAWAFNILWDGYLPSTGHGFGGGKLPPNLCVSEPGAREFLTTGQHRFCLTEVRGDWSWLVYFFNFRNRWTSTEICWKCRAQGRRANNILQDSYLDFSDTATWRQTEVTHVEWLNTMLKRGPACGLLASSSLANLKVSTCLIFRFQ